MQSIILTSPANASQNVATTGYLNWTHDIPDAVSFQVYINGTLQATTTNTSYKYTNLSFRTKYTWKIKETSTGIESPEYFFYTMREPDLTILSPNDNQQNVSITPTISWTSQEISGVTYKIFLDGFEFQSTTNTSYTVPSNKQLQYHKRYYLYVEFEYNNRIYRSNLINFTTRYSNMSGNIYLQHPQNNSKSGTTTSLHWISSLYPEPVKYEVYTNRTGTFLKENVDVIQTYAQLTNLTPTRVDPNNPSGPLIRSYISWYVKQYGPNGDTKTSETFTFEVVKQILYGKIYPSFPVYNQMYMDRSITYSWASDVGINADTAELNSYDVEYKVFVMRPEKGEVDFHEENGTVIDVTPERRYEPDIKKRFEFTNTDPYDPGEKIIWKVSQIYESTENGYSISESIDSPIMTFYVKPDSIQGPLQLIQPLNQQTNEHYEITLKWNKPFNYHVNNPVEYDVYTDHIGNRLMKIQTIKPDENWFTKTEYKIINYKKKNKIRWKIIQRDNIGTIVESDVYEFTTLYNKFNLPYYLEYHNIDGREITIDLNNYLKFDIDKNNTMFHQETTIGLLDENGIFTFMITENMENFELQFRVKNSSPVEYSEIYILPIYINKLPKVYNPLVYTINYGEEVRINLKDHIIDEDNDILTYEYIRENQQDNRSVVFYKDTMVIQSNSLKIGANLFRIRFTDNRIEEDALEPVYREQQITIIVEDNRTAPTLDLKSEYVINETETLKLNLWKLVRTNNQ